MEILFLILIAAVLSTNNSRIRSYEVPIAEPIREMMADPKASKQLQKCIAKGYGNVTHSNGTAYKICTKANRHKVGK